MINAKELFPDKESRDYVKSVLDLVEGTIVEVREDGKVIYS